MTHRAVMAAAAVAQQRFNAFAWLASPQVPDDLSRSCSVALTLTLILAFLGLSLSLAVALSRAFSRCSQLVSRECSVSCLCSHFLALTTANELAVALLPLTL